MTTSSTTRPSDASLFIAISFAVKIANGTLNTNHAMSAHIHHDTRNHPPAADSAGWQHPAVGSAGLQFG